MHLPNHKKDCVLIRKRGRQAMSVQGTSDWLTQHQIDDRLAAEARKPNSVLYFAAQNFEATYILEDNLKRKVNQLRKQYKEGKRVFTLVYNLSASNLTGKVDGSHWVCAVYDMRTATPRMQTKIQYFDSFGNKPPRDSVGTSLNVFRKNIFPNIGPKIHKDIGLVYNRRPFQQDTTECGVWVIWYILGVLKFGSLEQIPQEWENWTPPERRIAMDIASTHAERMKRKATLLKKVEATLLAPRRNPLWRPKGENGENMCWVNSSLYSFLAHKEVLEIGAEFQYHTKHICGKINTDHTPYVDKLSCYKMMRKTRENKDAWDNAFYEKWYTELMKNKGKIPDFTEYGYVGNPIGPMHFFKDVILNECTDGDDILMVAPFEIKKNALVELPSEVAGKRLISFARTIRGSSSSLDLSKGPELHATHFVAYARIMVDRKWKWQQNDMNDMDHTQNQGAIQTETLSEMRKKLKEDHHFSCVGLFLTRCVSSSSTIKRRQAMDGTASQSSILDITGEDDTATTPGRGVILGRQTINLETPRNGTTFSSSTIDLTGTDDTATPVDGLKLRKQTQEERDNDTESSIADSGSESDSDSEIEASVPATESSYSTFAKWQLKQYPITREDDEESIPDSVEGGEVQQSNEGSLKRSSTIKRSSTF